MNNNEKYCPFVRQACLTAQCEIYNEVIKRCQISVLSYNTYRLTEALKDKGAQVKEKGTPGSNMQKGPEIPF